MPGLQIIRKCKLILTGISQRIRDKDLVFTWHIDIDRMIVKLIKDKSGFLSIGCQSIDSCSKKTMEQISLLSPGTVIMDFKRYWNGSAGSFLIQNESILLER